MKPALLLMLILSLVPLIAAPDQPVFTHTPVAPEAEVINQVTILLGLIVPFMVTMVVLAAAVYVGGQFFGAETRAKATVWSYNMLAAVGVSAVIIVVLYAVLPNFFSGEVGDVVDVADKIAQIRGIAEMGLIGLMMLFLVMAAGAYAMGQMFGSETRARAAVWATGLFTGAIVCGVLYALLSMIIQPMAEAVAISASLSYAYAVVITNIVLGVAFIILITYLAAKVLKVAEWEAYLSIELANLMGTFLLVFFLLGMFAVGNLVAISYSGSTSPPQAAIEYIHGTIASSALRATIDVYKIQACTSMLSTFSRRIGEFVLTQTYKVFPGIDTFVQITNVLGFSLLTLYNTASVQVTLLHLADALMLPFFLPAGLILRFFPPTRDAGAFMIALAFGFQIVFPTTYLIHKEIYESIGGKPYESPDMLIQSLCGPFKYGVAGILLNPSANPLFGLIPGGTVAASFVSKLVSESLLNAVSMAEFVPIMRYIASLSLLALFMPALSMMVTIAFINSMTKFIVYKV